MEHVEGPTHPLDGKLDGPHFMLALISQRLFPLCLDTDGQAYMWLTEKEMLELSGWKE